MKKKKQLFLIDERTTWVFSDNLKVSSKQI